ncbi:hypothetical protein Tco_0953926 [Tanacetum coccineum]|uniref:Uncharacterized protein n=1 Tax=Tanacetum coccineum TaxID=301880 RepID=A0ABQ5E3I4_9ASTR
MISSKSRSCGQIVDVQNSEGYLPIELSSRILVLNGSQAASFYVWERRAQARENKWVAQRRLGSKDKFYWPYTWRYRRGMNKKAHREKLAARCKPENNAFFLDLGRRSQLRLVNSGLSRTTRHCGIGVDSFLEEVSFGLVRMEVGDSGIESS